MNAHAVAPSRPVPTELNLPVPANEEARLRALAGLSILDTTAEEAFDGVVRLASEICGTPVALVTLVDRQRQWFKAKVGMELVEIPRKLSFCAHAIAAGPELLEVRDTLEDERFAGNPMVADAPHLRFYAGKPLTTSDGFQVGTLCVVDMVPRELTAFQRGALDTLAQQVTAQMELRGALRRLAAREEEVVGQRDALLHAQRQREELMSLVVHDLKGPLAAMLPTARYVTEESTSPDVREAAEEIVACGETMHRLVLNLLDVSRSEDGQLEPSREPVDVGALLSRLQAATLRRAAEQRRGISLSAEGLVRRISADGDLLRRVFENLLDNALKYTPAGGEIRLEAWSAAGSLEVRVRDDGPGIPAEKRERVFDKYARLEQDAANHAGTSRGLGLTFCRLAVEAHGGRIWVEANEPRGSVFCVSLPALAVVLVG